MKKATINVITQLLPAIVERKYIYTLKPYGEEARDVPYFVRSAIDRLDSMWINDDDEPFIECPIFGQRILLPDQRVLVIRHGTRRSVDSSKQKSYAKYDRVVFEAMKGFVEQELSQIRHMDRKKETFLIYKYKDTVANTVAFEFFNELGGSTLHWITIKPTDDCLMGNIYWLKNKMAHLGYEVQISSNFELLNRYKLIAHLIDVSAEVIDRKVIVTFYYDLNKGDELFRQFMNNVTT